MKKIVAYEWTTRIVDFETKEDALEYLKEMQLKYKVNPYSYEIYNNGNDADNLPISLKVEYVTKNHKYNSGW